MPRLDSARTLRELRMRDRIHPDDVVVFAHPTRASFDESAVKNREYGHETYGPYETGDGFVAVIDLRPALAAQGCPLTDPALPDDHTPVPPWPTPRRDGSLPR